jgi:pterin-4a-carbinolamine dehydratase
MSELLGEDDIASRLEQSQWRREGDEIVREWRFEDFGNKVRLSLTNHSAGGLTDADFEMAARIDRL